MWPEEVQPRDGGVVVMAWSKDDVDTVKELLCAFADKGEVACTMDVDEDKLDGLCMDAFGMDYASTEERFHAVGIGRLKVAMAEQARSGNSKALDLMGRKYLDMAPVKSFTQKEADKAKKAKRAIDWGGE